MSINLDTYLTDTTNRYYYRLVNLYKKRMSKANDIQYTHSEFVKYCNLILEFRFNADVMQLMIATLDHDYKVGKEFSIAVKEVQKIMNKFISINGVGIIEAEPDFEIVDAETETLQYSDKQTAPIQKVFSLENQYSAIDIVRMFSEFKAYQRFKDFLKTDESAEQIEKPLTGIVPDFEKAEKSKDFTTARQVLSVHYLLKYANVKNVDKTEIARFIQFLTGKNLDNIYKKLQNPFKVNDKALKEDLRFVRDYFERLNLPEIVKMINNEIGA